ncbi:hypothetical protein SAMN05216486_101113 [bacterium JGI 053]|nr:hypothetical protein SAMN05216486_101113 [bacterium JGI 053]
MNTTTCVRAGMQVSNGTGQGSEYRVGTNSGGY